MNIHRFLILACMAMLAGCDSRSRSVNVPGASFKDERLPEQKQEGSFDGSQEKLVPRSRH